MLGSIAGDIIGSLYEGRKPPRNPANFPLFPKKVRFTDDTVLTIAVADVILNGGDYTETIKSYARRYPRAGYGESFHRWMRSDSLEPYGSYGNGSAMRVSPIGWAYEDRETVLGEAERSAAITHNHPEGIKGAQAVAFAVFLARTGSRKSRIIEEISSRFGYDLRSTLAVIRPRYHFDVTCQGSVPQSIISFLEAHSIEGAIRNAISLGGDADTMACIAGGIAEAYFGEVPEFMKEEIYERLPGEFIDVVERYRSRYITQ